MIGHVLKRRSIEVARSAGGAAAVFGLPRPTLAHCSGCVADGAAGFGWRDWLVASLFALELVAAVWVYWRLQRRFRHRPRQPAFFWAALVLLVVALASPLAAGGQQLLTLHMVQHLLLMAAIPILLALGTPLGLLAWLRHHPAWGPVFRRLVRPQPAFVLYHVTLVFWHIPPVYDFAVLSAPLHLAQHLSYLVTGTLFWGVLVAPHPALVEATDFERLGLLVGANMVMWILSFTIAFAGEAGNILYKVHAPTSLLWGLWPAEDMVVGGWVMGFVGQPLVILVLVPVLKRLLAGEPGEAGRGRGVEVPLPLRTDPRHRRGRPAPSTRIRPRALYE